MMKHRFNEFIAGCLCENCVAAPEGGAGSLQQRPAGLRAEDARPQVAALPAAVSEGSVDLPANASTAGRVAIGGSVHGTLSPAGDRDWFAMTLEAGRSYVISLSGTGTSPLPDPFLRLYAPNGVLVESNDDGGGGYNSRITYTASSSGTFFAEAGGYEDSQTGSYTLAAAEPLSPGPVASLWVEGGPRVQSSEVRVFFAPSGQAFSGEISRGWLAHEIDQAMLALQLFSNIANVSFTRTEDAASAHFALVVNSQPSVSTLGWFNMPSGTARLTGWFNAAASGWDAAGLEQGGYGFATLIHEFGHGLGLEHPHESGSGTTAMPGVTGAFGSYGTAGLNQGIFTMMSYNDGWVTGPMGVSPNNGWGWQATPMALDVAALQQAYGANTTYRTGADTYALPTTEQSGTFWSCLWDAGGQDTIVQPGNAAAVLDLRAASLAYAAGGAGFPSYVAGIHGGFTIAQGTTIENARGGGGDDTITGNDAANTLEGGGGNDVLAGGLGDDMVDGGAGEDVAAVGYLRGQGYTIAGTASRFTLTGAQGADTYVGVETIRFLDDTTIAASALFGSAPASTFGITATASARPEGNRGQSTAYEFTITRTGATDQPANVAWAAAGTGSAPASAADFVGGILPSGIASFAPGQASRTIIVPIAGDDAVEAQEGFAVTLSAPSSGSQIGTATATGTIQNDDASLAIAAASAAKPEGNAGSTAYTFTVTRSGATSQASSANWAVTGSGSAPASAGDFIGNALPSGTVSFAAGETSKTITVRVVGDSAAEQSEGFTVTLSGASAGTSIGTATAAGTIQNDDASLAIAASSPGKAEGNAGSTAFTFTVTRSGATGQASTANWVVAGAGSAPASAFDFVGNVLPSGTVSFAAGETSRTITVRVAGDSAVEQNEGFTVTLSGASAGTSIGTATAGGTIQNDDASLSIAAASAIKAEGNTGSTTFTFTVSRSGATGQASTASWAVTGSGSAPASAADFLGNALPSGMVSFAAGETSKTITVRVAGDSAAEQNEGFTVTLNGASAGTSIGIATASGTIQNDDALLSIAAASSARAEGHSGTTAFTFTVTRSGATGQASTAFWTVTGSGSFAASAADFVGNALPSGTVSFAAGETSKTVTVRVTGDAAVEQNEGFTVTLIQPSAGTSIGTATATGTILNDEFLSTSANQTLTGTAAEDLFLLGGGLDSVTGGASRDRFLFQSAALGSGSSNATTLQDFSRAAGEVIDLWVIDAIAGTLANDAFTFIGTAPFTAAGQLRWQNQGGGTLLIQGSVNADTAAELTIFVKASGPVDANWFAL